MNRPERGYRCRRRLQTVAALVAPGARVADLGSGHGILPRLLLASGRARHCVATELDRERLSEVRTFRSGHPLAGRLELRWGDGLAPLGPADDLDTVTIAGLGARSILRMLEPARLDALGIRHLVVQSQSETPRLRRGLIERGLHITQERLVEERGRVYEVVAAARGAGPPPECPGLSGDDLAEVGPCLVRSGDPLVVELWRKRRDDRKRILARARSTSAHAAAERRLATARRVLVVLGDGLEPSPRPPRDELGIIPPV